jgi:hypothetical protein
LGLGLETDTYQLFKLFIAFRRQLALLKSSYEIHMGDKKWRDKKLVQIATTTLLQPVHHTSKRPYVHLFIRRPKAVVQTNVRRQKLGAAA